MFLDKRGKIFCVTTYLDTKSFKTILKIDATQFCYKDFLLRQETQKRVHVLEADIITIKKSNIDLMLKGCIFNWTCTKLYLSQSWIIIILIGCIYFETPCIQIILYVTWNFMEFTQSSNGNKRKSANLTEFLVIIICHF